MDTTQVQQLQQALVDLMKKNGSLRSSAVEQAFLAVPRHLFLPNEPLERSYSDAAIAVKRAEEGRWTSSSSQPTMMAIMLEQLDLRPGQRVLEIGAGTGFNAALMSEIVGPQGSVVTIDVQPDLVEAARANLDAAGFSHVQALAADGGYGYPPGAPFDRIILTVASYVVTPAWRDQLAEGGRLVLPLELGMQKSVAFEKRGDELHSLSVADCGFMTLQGAFARPEPLRTQIGPDPDLYLVTADPLPFAPQQFAEWMEQPVVDKATGITATPWNLWFGLAAWNLRYEGPGWSPALLQAEGELAENPNLPRLQIMRMGEIKHAFTDVQLDPNGAAALTRPPGSPAQPNQAWEEGQSSPGPFEVYIRQYGEGQAALQRLERALREWDQAGRPGSENLRVRAIPADQGGGALPREMVVERPYTNFFIRYE